MSFSPNTLISRIWFNFYKIYTHSCKCNRTECSSSVLKHDIHLYWE